MCRDFYISQVNGPQPQAVRGQQQGLSTPSSSRERCYSSLPSKHCDPQHPHPPRAHPLEGFVPPIPATPGRTQLTPSASRSDGAELMGEFTSLFGTWCSIPLVVVFTGMNCFVESSLFFTTLKARKVIGVVVAWTRSRAQGAADTGYTRAHPTNTECEANSWR